MGFDMDFFAFILAPVAATVIFISIIYFFFNSITMSTPFKTMKAIYVYLAALIGLVVVAMGIYGLLEYFLSILFLNADFDAAYTINPITKIITGLFVMIPHWAIGHHFHSIEQKKKR